MVNDVKFSSAKPSCEKVTEVQKKSELCEKEGDILNKLTLVRNIPQNDSQACRLFPGSFGEFLRGFSSLFPCTCSSEVETLF